MQIRPGSRAKHLGGQILGLGGHKKHNNKNEILILRLQHITEDRTFRHQPETEIQKTKTAVLM